MYIKKKLLLFVFLLFLTQSFYSQQRTNTFEFINQNIKDILFVFSSYSNIPIVADDTIIGTTTFQFAGSNFEQAFDSFLQMNRLYAEKTDTIWIISKIKIIQNITGTYSIDAYDVSLSQIIEKFSSFTKTTITHDLLPATKQSIHIAEVSVKDALSILFRPYNEYTIEDEEQYLYIKRNQVIAQTVPIFAGGQLDISGANGLYTVLAERVSLKDILNRFFIETNQEYTSFAQSDLQIERINFSDKSFDTALRMILEMANAQAHYIDDTWYIFQISAETVQQNAIAKNKTWVRFELKHNSVSELQNLITTRFPSLSVHELADKKSFIVQVDEKHNADLTDYLALVDIPSVPYVISLKYIKAEDLLNNLPPSVQREDINLTGSSNTIFFTGSEEKQEQFLTDLKIIDIPQQRIRYDLLIVQYQKSSNLQWGISVDAAPLVPGDRNLITGTLGNLLSLNFDVVTVFGYLFAAKINTALGENEASIFADTTLYGVSGQTIEFENTNTYRYRDSNLDPETGKPVYSGITRELISGLMLDINGWVSGDGMITTTVTAAVSKQGVDLSSKTGNPPPSSEKKITTQVRSRSGEMVILSGLTQNDSSFVDEGVPFFSWLFGNKTRTEETTELVIYLVPHIDKDNTLQSVPERLMTAYVTHAQPFMQDRMVPLAETVP